MESGKNITSSLVLESKTLSSTFGLKTTQKFATGNGPNGSEVVTKERQRETETERGREVLSTSLFLPVNWIGTLLGNGIMLLLLLEMSITHCGAVYSQSIKPLIMQTQIFTNVTRKNAVSLRALSRKSKLAFLKKKLQNISGKAFFDALKIMLLYIYMLLQKRQVNYPSFSLLLKTHKVWLPRL